MISYMAQCVSENLVSSVMMIQKAQMVEIDRDLWFYRSHTALVLQEQVDADFKELYDVIIAEEYRVLVYRGAE